MAPFQITQITNLVDKKTAANYVSGFEEYPERSVRAISYADDL